MQSILEFECTLGDHMHFSIEYHRVIVDAVEVSLQALITAIVVVLQPLQDGLQADADWHLMPVKRVYLKVYVIDEDAEGRFLVSPGLHIGNQSLDMLCLDAGCLRQLFYLLTSSPNVYSSLDLFGVPSQSLALGLSYLY